MATADEAELANRLDSLRRWYLTDIHRLRDYRVGKNSFVEGPDRRWGSYTQPGQRLTLLNVEGSGSLRHIWSTRRAGNGKHRLEFYLDGAVQPQITGTLDELIDAAQRMPDPPVPVPGFVGNRDARNLFLPIPFQRGLRIEMETLEPTWLIFWQIDYRLDTAAQPDRRLLVSMVDGKLELKMPGPPEDAPLPIAATKPFRQTVTVPPSESLPVLKLTGPGIVRRWSVRADVDLAKQDRLDLNVVYDGVSSPAVRAPWSDFFGPFQGVSLVTDPNTGERACFLPMPIRHGAVFSIRNRLDQPVTIEVHAELEPVDEWQSDWGYFHLATNAANDWVSATSGALCPRPRTLAGNGVVRYGP